LARAFVRDASLLLLDEPTSALDAATEDVVQAGLAAWRRDRTTLVIAHRLSTVRAADSIIVLADGRVAEQGSHESLLKHGGVYARLVAAARGDVLGDARGDDRADVRGDALGDERGDALGDLPIDSSVSKV
jgi:ABC-type multidrug transport system fused ATPase/permease subunit